MCFINSRTCTITSTNNTCVIDFYFHSKLVNKYVNSKMKTESLKWTYFYDQSSNLITALLKFFFMNWPARGVKWQRAGLTAQDSPRVSWVFQICGYYMYVTSSLFLFLLLLLTLFSNNFWQRFRIMRAGEIEWESLRVLKNNEAKKIVRAWTLANSW